MTGSIKTKPLFLILLPVFFVLHGYTENYNSIPFRDALLLTVIYIAASFFIATVLWSYYKNFTKASLAALFVMTYYFFFGVVQDLLRDHFAGMIFSRYSFILLVSSLLFFYVFRSIKKSDHSFLKLARFFNVLFVLLIITDILWLTSKISLYERNLEKDIYSTGLVKCDGCKKPDIYFIILDGYSGNAALKEKFGFDNIDFENGLRQRGFHVIENSSSNYNYTPYSIASILNMNYLKLNMRTKNAGNLNHSYQAIRESKLVNFLKVNDYSIYNYSIFDLSGEPSISGDHFLPAKTKLITAQTFLSRIWNDILFDVSTGKLDLTGLNKKIVYSHLRNNNEFMALTLKTAATKSSSPKFIYTHLMMPHYPYYYDHNGNPLPFDSLKEGKQNSKHNYIEYLQYSNKKIDSLVAQIQKISSSDPVIVLMGDHGFRYFPEKEERKFCFMNLSAIYLPDRDYHNFYNQMTTVNIFPALLNSLFKQQVPMQKDSTIYLWE